MVRAVLLSCLAAAASADLYHVTYTTGAHADAGSGQEMLIQLQGSVGNSADISLGSSFTTGQTVTVDLNIDSSAIGSVTGVTLKSGGASTDTDDWNPVNFISLITPAAGAQGEQMLQFKTDYFLSADHPANTGGNFEYDEVYMTPEIPMAPVNPDSVRYAVRFQTGHLPNSASNSPVYIQLTGETGLTMFYLLGNSFASNTVYNRDLDVLEHNKIGNLKSIELVAAGTDSVTFVNFLEITTPGAEQIQFPADFALDAATHQSTDLASNLFPYHRKVTIDAIFAEQKSEAVQEFYQVEFDTAATSVSAEAASSSPMYVKFNGNRGSSNYLLLGNNFVAGAAVTKNYVVSHNLGLLQTITVMAGGTDNWLSAGSIRVKTANGEPMAFATDMYFDEQANNHDEDGLLDSFPVHDQVTLSPVGGVEPPLACAAAGQLDCCGNNVCDADETRNNCAVDCNVVTGDNGGWGDAETAATTTVAPAADTFNDLHVASATSNSAGNAATYTEAPTAAPTVAPTDAAVVLSECTIGSGGTTVPSGWHQQGIGNEYCNLCQCVDGTLSCTARQCGLPWQGTYPTNSHQCTAATTCTAPLNAAGVERILQVKHDGHAEPYTHHRCAYNKFSDVCTCFCWGAKPVVFTEGSTSGSASVATGACTAISFSGNGFNPESGSVKALLTGTAADLLWVQSSTATELTVCAKDDSGTSSAAAIDVNYYAYQAFPYGGAETGRPHMNIDANVNINGPTCKIVQFAKTFVSTPVVVGSIDDASAEKGAAWIENVNKNQFRYCYRESGAQASGVGTAGGNSAGTQTDADGNPSSHDDVYFNFVAFVHKNPDAWYAANALPYLEANNAAIAHHGCTTVNFARTHSIAPKVFVTANHQDDATVDWNAAPHDAVNTWVTSVTTTGFEVCSSELAIHATGNEDDNLQVSYVAMA